MQALQCAAGGNVNVEMNAAPGVDLTVLDAFSREPEINRNSGKLLETARYRGIMTQDGTDYYIVIKDIAAGRKSITMAEKFYMVLFLVLMVPGSICMMLLWKALLKPLSEFEASLVYRASSRTARSTQRNPVKK